MIAEARIKTDSIDSETLAHLLRADLVLKSYVPPRWVRDERQITRHRAGLVKIRSIIKNRVHALLTKHGITYEFSDLFGRSGIEFLRQVDVPPATRFELDHYLMLIRVLNYKIEETQKQIELMVEDNPDARLLTSIPGISYYSALLK